MNEEYFLMWLTKIEGIGHRKIGLLLSHFETARDIWAAPRRLLETVQGLTPQNISAIVASRDENALQAQLLEMEKKRIQFISMFHANYPPLLRTIPDPPVGLYIMGQYPAEHKCFVSVVGSRKCTEYGQMSAYRIAKELAEKNVVIVSGMATGIDGMAHQAAVDAGGVTIAVLGCGVDVCYPAHHDRLKEKILQKGCIMSEFPPGTKPLPSHFPLRNRIVSGLSQALIVVEATEKSGTSITVDQALEQGREVLAVPGKITSKFSQGTNRLLKEGAGVVTSGQDILDALGFFETVSHKNVKQNSENLAPDEKLVYDCIGLNPISVDEIVAVAGTNVPTANYILLTLEIKGRIQKLQGQRYVRS